MNHRGIILTFQMSSFQLLKDFRLFDIEVCQLSVLLYLVENSSAVGLRGNGVYVMRL